MQKNQCRENKKTGNDLWIKQKKLQLIRTALAKKKDKRMEP